MAKVVRERIWCEGGRHYWEREPKRGPTPKNCVDFPDCPPDESEPEPSNSKGISIWLSNADIAFLKKLLANDHSKQAERIKAELC